ncbi:MAG: hypothetical protein LBK60_11285 [Verrucomicrobiales bacterium]|jgi:hypothetical protein|nr:hypothetical protein [Verrucomicrobiales bacterium]
MAFMIIGTVLLPTIAQAQTDSVVAAGAGISRALHTVLTAGYEIQSIIYGEWIGEYGGFLVALRYAVGLTDDRRVAGLFLSLFLFCTGYVVINAAVSAWMLVGS